MDTPLHEFLGRRSVDVAPLLLGWLFSTRVDGVRTTVRLTEVEAYMGEDDPASHAFRGRTRRTAPMFEAGGVIYIYRSYGIHNCVNVVTGSEGTAGAVLLRAGIPIAGIDAMVARRGRDTHVADGPGKLGQALGLSTEHSGLPIDGDLIQLLPGMAPRQITATPRIGISRATDRPWRFVAGT
jgi:DNA-3-methyladenine glycosylase